MTSRQRIHEILESGRADDPLSRAFDIFLVSLIALNVVVMVFETMASVKAYAGGFFRWFEIVSVAIFTVEYLLRIWTCVLDPRYASPITGRIRFALSPLALIDLAAILPFYLPTTAMDARSLRAVRLVRVLRILKLARYSDALRTFGRVFVAQKEPLGLTVFLLMLLLVMSASFMYYAEREAQPEVFSSIPATMWWAVATLSTVGYGDTFPVTEWGRVLGSIIAFLGIGMFALPTGILGAGFIEEYQGRRESKTCPHCGKQIE